MWQRWTELRVSMSVLKWDVLTYSFFSSVSRTRKVMSFTSSNLKRHEWRVWQYSKLGARSTCTSQRLWFTEPLYVKGICTRTRTKIKIHWSWILNVILNEGNQLALVKEWTLEPEQGKLLAGSENTRSKPSSVRAGQVEQEAARRGPGRQLGDSVRRTPWGRITATSFQYTLMESLLVLVFWGCIHAQHKLESKTRHLFAHGAWSLGWRC